MRSLLRGLSPLALGVALAVAPAAAQMPDHLKCYKVKDPLKLAGTADLDTPQFGPDAGCRLSNTKLFCVPATKTNVTATDRATGAPITPMPFGGPDPGDRICYKVKCATPLVLDQPVTDQFGGPRWRQPSSQSPATSVGRYPVAFQRKCGWAQPNM